MRLCQQQYNIQQLKNMRRPPASYMLNFNKMIVKTSTMSKKKFLSLSKSCKYTYFIVKRIHFDNKIYCGLII